MFNSTKILCPVDFDQNSAEAMRFACKLLELGGTLYLLHVIPEAERPGFEQYPPITELAQQNLDNFARKQIGDQIARKLFVRAGDPAALTIRLADELGVDLIVMATHGHKGLVRIVLGSVAERVLRDARCPVLTLRPALSKQPPSA
ncbi:MAG: universal stress protein [Deltaproteobacteria bacterium]|nr:universal stress protein [Deltaproteobacteria bacterium]